MAERVSTGLAGLDIVIDFLRIGDNVVWQVDRLEDYAYFARQFANQVRKDHRRLVYLRFGQHPPLVDHADAIYKLDAELGFEGFSSRVYQIATQEGRGVCYIFDSLSDLVSTWATDLMVGNFFRVTCPYLFDLDTIAYFAILRGQNSYQTIARIRETTQLFLDVYQLQEHMYLHPLKVFNRYSPTMYLPHIQNSDTFDPITNSLEAARLFTKSNQTRPGDTGRKLDYWDRVFLQAEQLIAHHHETDAPTDQEKQLIDRLSRMLLGRDEKILALAGKHLNLARLLAIRYRMLGSGFIGGKSVGMLLARAILENDTSRLWHQYLEPHDSFYVGSDVYYTFLVENDCWSLLQQVRRPAPDPQAVAALREKIIHGRIPETIAEQFNQLLDYYGQAPIIVRSSSLLEDSYNNAFAGKYQSIFCVNQGPMDKRFQLFTRAVKEVYASTLDVDTLAYLEQRGLSGLDEQMGLLVQRVSGSHHGKYFFPDLAGVGLSCNPYIWNKQLNPQAGLLRLVAGMGTRAVERVDEDYPCIAPLDHPQVQPVATQEDRHRFSQHFIDVLDLEHNELVTLPLRSLYPLRQELRVWPLVATRDTKQRMPNETWILDFNPLFAAHDFWLTMQDLMQVLETAYGHPVEVEFTLNINPGTNMFNLNLLQCRPFSAYMRGSRPYALPPAVKTPHTIMIAQGSMMGGSRSHSLDALVYIIPEEYARLSLTDRYQVARVVGQLNRTLGQRGFSFLLAGPGRWGTSTPSLGIPVSFAEIHHAAVLTEIAFVTSGFSPELSFGTHFFHDLVEAGIFYMSLFPEQSQAAYGHNLLASRPNHLTGLLPLAAKLEPIIRVWLPDKEGEIMWFTADHSSQTAHCWVASSFSKE